MPIGPFMYSGAGGCASTLRSSSPELACARPRLPIGQDLLADQHLAILVGGATGCSQPLEEAFGGGVAKVAARD
jgi:hypothetical protein